MNKAKGRQHTRKAARRAALRVKRARKVMEKKVDRQKRIENAQCKRGSGLIPKKKSPSDIRRHARRHGGSQ